MPRQVRIEFPGAVYHAMARGDRREDIVRADGDREAFVSLLGELVDRTGWEMFSWVLMSNHYHLVFKTPEPNLVAGMKWLQNTWTKRFNAHHRLWGHVFGGRYKAVLVEENEHLGCLIDYVHLNPVRAGLIRGKMELAHYRWSSLGDYMLPPRKRSGWVRVERGLQQRGYRRDTASERRRYLEHLEGIARQEGGIPPQPDGEGRSLQSTLQRGWFFGTEGFREKMLEKLKGVKRSEAGSHHRSSGYTGEQARDHGEWMAGRILELGLDEAGLSREELTNLAKGDWRKRVIGRAIRCRTVVAAGWIAENLLMGVPTRTATLVATEPGPEWGRDWKEAKRLAGRLAKKIENLD